ncbi:MAG: transcriptional regulator NrdR [Candidatus Gracilibacteria bacterium]|jgi:transcriptional repressor NrdR|nr:transcriptional regulator NrdR [Candidatus Gracilibacteria bacterium]
MQCPKCKNQDTRVIDSRSSEEGRVIRRRRECEKCETRFTTLEKIEIIGLIVKKADNRTEAYSREKLKKGIVLACGKRPITEDRIDDMIYSLEEKWCTKKDISAREIGEDVMNGLKKLDDIAFIRFASVYRSFCDLDEFKSEIFNLFKK